MAELKAELLRLEAGGSDKAQLAQQHFILAVAHLRREEYGEAIRHLEQSLTYKENDPITLAYLGASLLEEYRVDEAREQLEKALALAPDQMLVWLKMGEFHYRLGFYPQALHHLEAASRLQAPNEATAQYLVTLLTKVRKLNRNIIVRNPVVPNLKKIRAFFKRVVPGRHRATGYAD
jgi:tetratricopeptide (TPR) repeat protein